MEGESRPSTPCLTPESGTGVGAADVPLIESTLVTAGGAVCSSAGDAIHGGSSGEPSPHTTCASSVALAGEDISSAPHTTGDDAAAGLDDDKDVSVDEDAIAKHVCQMHEASRETRRLQDRARRERQQAARREGTAGYDAGPRKLEELRFLREHTPAIEQKRERKAVKRLGEEDMPPQRLPDHSRVCQPRNTLPPFVDTDHAAFQSGAADRASALDCGSQRRTSLDAQSHRRNVLVCAECGTVCHSSSGLTLHIQVCGECRVLCVYIRARTRARLRTHTHTFTNS